MMKMVQKSGTRGWGSYLDNCVFPTIPATPTIKLLELGWRGPGWRPGRGRGDRRIGRNWSRRRRRSAAAVVLNTSQIPILKMVAPLIVVVSRHDIADKDIVVAMILIAGNFGGGILIVTSIISLCTYRNGNACYVLASLRATPVTARRATRAVPLAIGFGRIISITTGADQLRRKISITIRFDKTGVFALRLRLGQRTATLYLSRRTLKILVVSTTTAATAAALFIGDSAVASRIIIANITDAAPPSTVTTTKLISWSAGVIRGASIG